MKNKVILKGILVNERNGMGQRGRMEIEYPIAMRNSKEQKEEEKKVRKGAK